MGAAGAGEGGRGGEGLRGDSAGYEGEQGLSKPLPSACLTGDR